MFWQVFLLYALFFMFCFSAETQKEELPALPFVIW
jgi:hypothetical protein